MAALWLLLLYLCAGAAPGDSGAAEIVAQAGNEKRGQWRPAAPMR